MTTAGSRLAGQVALVTGGGTGIGRATADALAREGAAVLVVGRRPGPLEETVRAVRASGGDAWSAVLDVGDAEGAQSVVDALVARTGRIDVLVNNAGLNVPARSLAALSVPDWHSVVTTNLTGTYLVTRACLPVMRAQGSGTVVNISSTSGHRPSPLTGPAYNAAKAGVNAFTESVNLAERVNGIRACSLCPGEVATPLLEQRPQPPSAQARATMLQPEDVAATVVFVATMPPRVTVELLTMWPTTPRDWTDELR